MEQEAGKILKQILGLLIEEALEKETARQEIIDEVFRRLNHRTKRLEAAETLLCRAEPVLHAFGDRSMTAHRLSEEIGGFLAEGS